MVMPANPIEVPVAPVISVDDDCEINVEAPFQLSVLLIKVNGNFVAAPLVGTLTIDLTGDVPTAFCTNPSADYPTEWLNGQVSGDLVFFDIPFTVSDGTVEYITSSISYNPTADSFSIYTGNTSDGGYYEFVCTLICE